MDTRTQEAELQHDATSAEAQNHSRQTGRRVGFDIPYVVTPFYNRQIRKGPYFEQLKRTVEPSNAEESDFGILDTSGELGNTITLGLQHKYPQTALILVTDKCISYCRFCFRKRVVSGASEEIATNYQEIAQYISRHPEINNVLLSGGDPLALESEKLHHIIDHILPIPHISSIRIGSKAMAYEPARFDDPELLRVFERIKQAGKTPLLITHFDHVGEISDEAIEKVNLLRQKGVQLLNQMVLIKNVNDDPKVLADTISALHSSGIRPYYLFQARPVKGASHFQVTLRRGIELVKNVNARLSGIQKTFSYVMSHRTGKIEILDLLNDQVYMRYRQCKNSEKIGELFWRRHVEGACWLDDMPQR